ncbi:unnamed protein product [Bursaphelenchus okinawaensis]|uniref:Tyrosinase copper-binding domain-containing protein n=1 Tax=Bursaphelenchus okinawaensis TaxID=465554 RepID=A0A811KY04_9BILA|nr:unnamed protein product [Bursaphelenchus okinawaensis]CAG9112856.1 unnamed protein product [Bursaphelenchus okinawaensis]
MVSTSGSHIGSTSFCHDPEFCMHPTDNATQLDEMKWPEKIRDYVHCMDLVCQCGAFNGTVVGNNCVLQNGKVLRKALRKEFRQLTTEERVAYTSVLQQLHQEGVLNYLGTLHKTAGIHSGPAFFPWHREFFKRTELLLRTYNPEIAIPYWDSTLDNYLADPYSSMMFTYDLLGEPGERGYVYNTVFSNWTTMDGRPTWYRSFGKEPDGELFNNKRIEWVMSQTDVHYVLTYSLPLIGCKGYYLDERFLEYSHDYVHYFMSGDMQDRATSSNDPAFFLHHSFVDSIWEDWRQAKQRPEQREEDWPIDNLECAPGWHFKNASMPLLKPFKNKDALSRKYTENLFSYASRPTCTNETKDCGSEFLFCDTVTTPESPHCVAKVKFTGSCTGFEWSDDICYFGKCINGTCQPRKEDVPLGFPTPPTFVIPENHPFFTHPKKIGPKGKGNGDERKENEVKLDNDDNKDKVNSKFVQEEANSSNDGDSSDDSEDENFLSKEPSGSIEKTAVKLESETLKIKAPRRTEFVSKTSRFM